MPHNDSKTVNQLSSDAQIIKHIRDAVECGDDAIKIALNDIVLAHTTQQVERIMPDAAKFARDLYLGEDHQSAYVAGYCAGAIHYALPAEATSTMLDEVYDNDRADDWCGHDVSERSMRAIWRRFISKLPLHKVSR